MPFGKSKTDFQSDTKNLNHFMCSGAPILLFPAMRTIRHEIKATK